MLERASTSCWWIAKPPSVSPSSESRISKRAVWPGIQQADREGERHRDVVGRRGRHRVGAVERAGLCVREDVAEHEAGLVDLVVLAARERAGRGRVLVEEGVERLVDLAVEDTTGSERPASGAALVLVNS